PTRVKRDAMPMRVNRPADWIGGRCASRPTGSAHGVSFAGQLLCHRAAGRHEERYQRPCYLGYPTLDAFCMSRACHVWTAPEVQEETLTFPRIVRLQAKRIRANKLCTFAFSI